jgi:hypothetical protein
MSEVRMRRRQIPGQHPKTQATKGHPMMMIKREKRPVDWWCLVDARIVESLPHHQKVKFSWKFQQKTNIGEKRRTVDFL